jgi:carboxyl-terminal processing protease
MSERKQKLLWLSSGLVICLCLAFTAGFAVYRLRSEALAAHRAPAPEVKVFWEAWDRAEKHFFGDTPSAQTRTYGAIRRSLSLLDPYTVFVEPVTRELEQDALRGEYGGIGVSLRRHTEGRIILDPYPGSPAERAGLMKGDLLVAVEGEPVGPESTDDVRARLRGEVGTTVNLTLERPSGLRFDVAVERETIEVPSVTWRLQTSRIGYVHLSSFTDRTDSELDAALGRLDEADVIGLVVDLRDNRGGLLDPAVAVASRFLRDGDVLLHQSGREGERTYRAQSTGDLTTPLVVLVNGGTASAAEIVAGALQDNDRALLVGEKTFGKGSVQEIYELSDGSSVHVTAAIWLTPDRQPIDQNGLQPDESVPAGDDAGDRPLEVAVDYLESE